MYHLIDLNWPLLNMCIAFFVSIALPLSFYVFIQSPLKKNRDDPEMILSRIYCVFVVGFSLYIGMVFLLPYPFDIFPKLRLEDWLLVGKGIIIGIIVNSLLFLGPIFHDWETYRNDFLTNSGFIKWYRKKQDFLPIHWTPIFKAIVLCDLDYVQNSNDWNTLRSIYIAPIFEEMIYRATLFPIIYTIPSMTIGWTCIIAAALFGFAHSHHIFHKVIHEHVPVLFAFSQFAVQFTYTFLFSLYAGYIYVRTGTIWSSIAMHMFSNFLGLPDFSILKQPRYLFATLLGVILFAIALSNLTTITSDDSVFY